MTTSCAIISIKYIVRNRLRIWHQNKNVNKRKRSRTTNTTRLNENVCHLHIIEYWNNILIQIFIDVRLGVSLLFEFWRINICSTNKPSYGAILYAATFIISLNQVKHISNLMVEIEKNSIRIQPQFRHKTVLLSFALNNSINKMIAIIFHWNCRVLIIRGWIE